MSWEKQAQNCNENYDKEWQAAQKANWEDYLKGFKAGLIEAMGETFGNILYGDMTDGTDKGWSEEMKQNVVMLKVVLDEAAKSIQTDGPSIDPTATVLWPGLERYSPSREVNIMLRDAKRIIDRKDSVVGVVKEAVTKFETMLKEACDPAAKDYAFIPSKTAQNPVAKALRRFEEGNRFEPLYRRIQEITNASKNPILKRLWNNRAEMAFGRSLVSAGPTRGLKADDEAFILPQMIRGLKVMTGVNHAKVVFQVELDAVKTALGMPQLTTSHEDYGKLVKPEKVEVKIPDMEKTVQLDIDKLQGNSVLKEANVKENETTSKEDNNKQEGNPVQNKEEKGKESEDTSKENDNKPGEVPVQNQEEEMESEESSLLDIDLTALLAAGKNQQLQTVLNRQILNASAGACLNQLEVLFDYGLEDAEQGKTTLDPMSLIIVEGKTIRQIAQELSKETIEDPEDARQENLSQEKYMLRDLYLKSENSYMDKLRFCAAVVTGAASSNRRIAVLSLGEDNEVSRNYTELVPEKDSWTLSRTGDVDVRPVLNLWERFWSNFGFYKDKVAEVEHYNAVAAARAAAVAKKDSIDKAPKNSEIKKALDHLVDMEVENGQIVNENENQQNVNENVDENGDFEINTDSKNGVKLHHPDEGLNEPGSEEEPVKVEDKSNILPNDGKEKENKNVVKDEEDKDEKKPTNKIIIDEKVIENFLSEDQAEQDTEIKIDISDSNVKDKDESKDEKKVKAPGKIKDEDKIKIEIKIPDENEGEIENKGKNEVKAEEKKPQPKPEAKPAKPLEQMPLLARLIIASKEGQKMNNPDVDAEPVMSHLAFADYYKAMENEPTTLTVQGLSYANNHSALLNSQMQNGKLEEVGSLLKETLPLLAHHAVSSANGLTPEALQNLEDAALMYHLLEFNPELMEAAGLDERSDDFIALRASANMLNAVETARMAQATLLTEENLTPQQSHDLVVQVAVGDMVEKLLKDNAELSHGEAEESPDVSYMKEGTEEYNAEIMAFGKAMLNGKPFDPAKPLAEHIEKSGMMKTLDETAKGDPRTYQAFVEGGKVERQKFMESNGVFKTDLGDIMKKALTVGKGMTK